MLNPFPSLLTYGLLAPFLIRVTLGAIALSGAYLGIKKDPRKAFSYVCALSGLSLVLGFYTQIGALLLIALYGMMLSWEKKRGAMTMRDNWYYAIIIIAAVSLLFSSAGFLAFDLPL